MLTAEDKTRIREEMVLREEIGREISASAADRRRGRWGFLNGPFVVTFLGGVLIAFIGHVWQSTAASREMQRLRWQTLQDRKYDLCVQSTHDLESSLMVLGSLVKLRIRMAAAKKNDDATESATELAAMEQKHGELWRSYLQQRKPNVTFAHIRTVFRDPSIRDMVDDLDRTIIKMQKSESEEEVGEYVEDISHKLGRLTRAMGNEVDMDARGPAD